MSSVAVLAAARAPRLDGARAPIHLLVNRRSGVVGEGLRERLVQAAGWRPSARIKVAYDGETAWMQLPLRFAVGERPLWLVAPPLLHDAAQTSAPTRAAA